MQTHLKAVLVITVGALWVMLALTKESPRVVLVRPPSVVSDRDTIVLQVRVEPDAENRLLVLVAAEDGVVVRRSDEALEGNKAPRTRWVRWRLPAGDLTLVALLYGPAGERGRATHPLMVFSSLPSQ